MYQIPAVFKAVDRMTAPMRNMERAGLGLTNRLVTMGVKGERAFRKINTWADNSLNKIFNLRNAAGALVAAMAFDRIYKGVVEVAKQGDEIAKTSRRLGLTAEAYQELGYAAELSGVSQSAYAKSLEKLNKNVGDLQAGTGILRTSLLKTNPALAKQLAQVESNEQAFNLMVGAIQDAPTVFAKTKLAEDAFGRSGAEMINLLEVGTGGIEALRKQLVAMGGVLSNDAAKSAEDFMDAQTNMNRSMLSMKYIVGTELMPVIQKVVENITSWTTNNKALIKSKVSEWAEKVGNAISFVSDNFDDFLRVGKLVVGTLITLKGISIISSAIVNGFAAAQTMATGAQWLWNAAMNANPIGLIIIGVVALIALIVQIVKHWDEWGAAVSIFLGPLGFVISLIQSFRKHWDSVVQAFETGGILGALKRIGFVIVDAVLKPVQQLLELIGKIPFMTDFSVGGIEQIQNMIDQADKWSAPVQGVNKNLGAQDQVKQNKPQQYDLISTEKTKMETQQTFIESIQKQQLQVDINDKSNGKAKVKSSGIPVKLSPTFSY